MEMVDHDRRRYHRARFSPYTPAIVSGDDFSGLHDSKCYISIQSHTRRVSLPNVAKEEGIRVSF